MITTAVPRKVLSRPERTAALTAIATAKTKHKHVGIRPQKERGADKKSSGILILPGGNRGAALDKALWKAGEAWPASNSWEIFGSDDFQEFPNQAHCEDAFGDGCFVDPCVYGEFETADETSLLDL